MFPGERFFLRQERGYLFADESRSTCALCTLAVFMLMVSSCGFGFSCHGAGSGLEERSSLIPNYDKNI